MEIFSSFSLAFNCNKNRCQGEQNIFYLGNELSGKGVPNVSDCCNLCGLTSGCTAWSYNIAFKYCYLKTAAPTDPANKLALDGIFSGIMLP